MSGDDGLRAALAEAQVGHWRRDDGFRCSCGADIITGFLGHLADRLLALPEVAALRAKAAAADRVRELAERWIAATVDDPLGEPGILRAAGLDLRRRIDEAAKTC